MNHPLELLADLLDGTLDADARARVEAHLATCPTCREDLAAAEQGRDAARGLPPIPVPSDLRGRIVAAAGGGAPARIPRWYGWAGAAAAAALIAVIALSLPELGGGTAADRAEGEFSAAGSAVGAESEPGGGVPLEVRDVNYRETDLERLASEATALGAAEVSSPQAGAEAAAADRATGCVTGAFENQPSGRLVHLIRARFEGRPAYVAVYLEGPGADQEPDTAVVWVAAIDDCTILSFAQARL